MDTVRHCPAQGIGWEVMHIDGGGFQTPGGAGILEIADQSFFSVSTLTVGHPAAANAAR
jgi:hypothetical protein